MFDSNFIERLLPPYLRKIVHIAWLTVIHKPAKAIYETFVSFKNTTNNCLLYNSQTLSLQEFLRRNFNSIGINIVNDYSNIDPIFIRWLFEAQPAEYCYWLSEAESTDNPAIYWLSEERNATLYYDFIVEVPSALMDREPEIRAFINKVKLAGKRYKIVYY